MSIIAFPVKEDFPMKTETIYVVVGKDWDKPDKTHSLGYARGDPAVIHAFYNNDKYNGVSVQPVDVREITYEMLEGKNKVHAEKSLLMHRLGELEKLLEELK